MTRKRCKRRVYELNSNIVGRVLSGVALISEKNLNRIRLLELSQIEALATDKGTWQDIAGVRDMANLAETFADHGVGPEALPACEAAQEAILAIIARFERWQKVQATPAEIRALRDVFEYHDLQRQAVSVAQYEKLLRVTIARLATGHPKVKEVC